MGVPLRARRLVPEEVDKEVGCVDGRADLPLRIPGTTAAVRLYCEGFYEKKLYGVIEKASFNFEPAAAQSPQAAVQRMSRFGAVTCFLLFPSLH